MSSVVETKATMTSTPMYLDNVSSTGSVPDGGDSAPPDPDPGPIKG